MVGNEMTAGRNPRRSLEAMGRKVQGTLYVGVGDDFFELTEVAGLVWSLCDGSRNVDALAEAIADEYEVSVDTAREDIIACLADLDQQGLIEWVD